MELAAPHSPAPITTAPPRMPLFVGGTHAHRHTVHSALVSLAALGIGAHRISVRRSGRDAHQPGTVVRQTPAAGTVLTPDVAILLEISGLGFTQALPVGMWDSGGESAAGTREILDSFDDPLEKLRHWFHEGAPLFRIAPEDLAACQRWLALFGINAELWPRPLWYRLATLAAHLPQLSCSAEGCTVVLRSLLGLPVSGFRVRPTLSVLPAHALSHLGGAASHLGVDCVVGDAMEDLGSLEIEIGPVSLEQYQTFVETEAGAALLRRVLDLILPISTSFDLRWVVKDRNKSPQLGIPAANSRLGVNTYMGQRSPVSRSAL